MFEYNICNQADEELFYKQCKAIEDNIRVLKKDRLIEDVDGSLIQMYSNHLGKIVVRNDLHVDALYVTSDFDLLPFFKKNRILAFKQKTNYQNGSWSSVFNLYCPGQYIPHRTR